MGDGLLVRGVPTPRLRLRIEANECEWKVKTVAELSHSSRGLQLIKIWAHCGCGNNNARDEEGRLSPAEFRGRTIISEAPGRRAD